MPSPVNIALRNAPASPSKSSSAPQPPSDATGAEGFREELTRQRRADAPADAGSARRAELKPAPRRKAGQPVRPNRRDPTAPADKPEIRAAPADGAEAGAVAKVPAAAPEAPADGERDATAAPADGGATAKAEVSPVEHQDAVDPNAAPAAAAPLLAEATNVIPIESGETPPEADGKLTALNKTLQEAVRPVVFHPADAPANADPSGIGNGEASGTPAAADAKVAPLFKEASAMGEPGTADSGDTAAHGDDARHARAVPGADGGVPESSADVPAQPAMAEQPAHASAHATDFSSTAPPGLTESRPAAPQAAHATALAPAAEALPPEVRFASANHENIVTSMRAEVLPNGGTMRIRLDPPQLGAMQVTVRIQDGLITAAFETSSDEATRLLGHSLNQLKSVLESHGVGVDRLQVQQTPRETQSSNAQTDHRRDQGGGPSHEQEQSARQEQQRRDMLRKMWRRLTGEPDPLDLTA